MNKAGLVSAVAQKTGVSRKDAEQVVTAVFDAVIDALRKGEKVRIIGFGIFDVKHRAARIGRNPKTLEEIEIPATKTPFFKAGKLMKENVAN